MWEKKKTRKLLKLLGEHRSILKECRLIISDHHIEIKMHLYNKTEENWVYVDAAGKSYKSFIYSIRTHLENIKNGK